MDLDPPGQVQLEDRQREIRRTGAALAGELVDLDRVRAEEAEGAFDRFMTGDASEIQMAGFLKVGDPTDTKTIVGPVISAAHR